MSDILRQIERSRPLILNITRGKLNAAFLEIVLMYTLMESYAPALIESSEIRNSITPVLVKLVPLSRPSSRKHEVGPGKLHGFEASRREFCDFFPLSRGFETPRDSLVQDLMVSGCTKGQNSISTDMSRSCRTVGEHKEAGFASI